MKQAIIIQTTPVRYDWLQNCLKSLDGYKKYPVIIISSMEFNILPMVLEMDIDEVAFLTDTIEVRHTAYFDLLFEDNKGKNVSLVKSLPYPFWLGLGKFKMDLLRKIPDYEIKSHTEQTEAEVKFGKKVVELDPEWVGLFDDLPYEVSNYTHFEFKYGRNNAVFGNDYILKYQRTGQLADMEERYR